MTDRIVLKKRSPLFFMLSLEGGGTDLNLTGASQVIYFDGWWNPTVENQATGRAFRVGQQRDAMVQKFVVPAYRGRKVVPP